VCCISTPSLFSCGLVLSAPTTRLQKRLQALRRLLPKSSGLTGILARITLSAPPCLPLEGSSSQHQFKCAPGKSDSPRLKAEKALPFYPRCVWDSAQQTDTSRDEVLCHYISVTIQLPLMRPKGRREGNNISRIIKSLLWWQIGHGDVPTVPTAPSSLPQHPCGGCPSALPLLTTYLETKVEGLANTQLSLSLVHSQKEN